MMARLAAERLAILRRQRERVEATKAETVSLRRFAESPRFCNLTLSPLIAAIMDAAEGIRPDTIGDDECARCFGCTLAELPCKRSYTIAVRAGGRGGKTSRLVAVQSIYAAWTVALPTIAKGEEAVSLIIAPDLKQSGHALQFVRGYIDNSPELSAAKVGESADCVHIRRPHDGAVVVIMVRAASRGGRGGRAFTLVSAALDEACFFRDESSGIVNDAEMYRAVVPRIVPGGWCWLASTPWVAGTGLLEDMIGKNWGTHENCLCVVAPTRSLNPTWDPDGSIEANMRATDPDNADREIDAVPMVAGSAQFFDGSALKSAIDVDRSASLSPVPGAMYGSGGDFAFKRNSSAQAIVWREQRPTVRDGPPSLPHFHLVTLDEQRPEKGMPLRPSAVVDSFAAVLTEYGVGEVGADSHERAEVSSEFDRHNVTVVAIPEGVTGKAETYTLVRTLFREGRLHLPENPRLNRQLQDVVGKPMPGGGLSISSPHKADGSHGDLVSALVAAVWMAVRATPPRRNRLYMIGKPEISW